MSTPELFLAPSCDCPGTPDSPVRGFIGGSDCRQRCVCPSVEIIAEVEHKTCVMGGYRQFDAAPDATTPPTYYKRREQERYHDNSGYNYTQSKVWTTGTIDVEYDIKSCGWCKEHGGGEKATYTYEWCTENFSYAPERSGYTPISEEWGYVDGELKIVDYLPSVTLPEPDAVNDRCYGHPYDGPQVDFQSTTEYGELGAISLDTNISQNRTIRYTWSFRQPERTYTTLLHCPRDGYTEFSGWIDYGIGAGDTEYSVHSYSAELLSKPWTEEEVIEAVQAGDSSAWRYPAQARWQVRSGSTWQWARSSELKLLAKGLVEGVTYEVKLIIDESVDIDGQDLSWEEVGVDWEPFTATAADIDDGREIDLGTLEPVRGIWTRVTGALIRIVEEAA